MSSKIIVDKKDHTASEGSSLYFITHRFKNGNYLAFYSHSPWGRVHNQLRGWVVFTEDGELKDHIETYDWGNTGNDYRGWLREQIDLYGARTTVKNEWGERAWRMVS